MNTRSAIAAEGHKFRTANISRRAQKIVISPIKEMSILADTFREETGADVISFGQGIPYADTPSHIKKAIVKALQKKSTGRYTLEPGMTELRELVAKHIQDSRKISKVRAKEEIMITVGCQEAVACALAATINEGDEVLLFTPCFASHIEQTMQFGGIPKFVPLSEQNAWRVDLEALEKSVTKKTKVLLFSNPSNPTGSVLSKKEAEGIARIAKRHNLIIITDETYDFLTYDRAVHISLASFKSVKDRTILCGSFSKKYALTGYRAGFVYADGGIIDQMLKTHDALAICAPAISQEAAIAALKGSQSFVRDLVKKMTLNRKLMCEKLDELKEFFSYQKPMGAYYILAKYKFPNINSFDLALKILKSAHVITIPGGAFGPAGEGHIRFSFACSPEEIKEGFARLKAWASNFRS
ncbi:MAG: pyridoxal phosphate-dependent aminotransferase [Candidatus Wildermuthbacteria bacterium]|nr:pyridoxal phosphate-dependent aminotransferase [Candidatus Wildermuthbacteria bacterium]